jgi:tetrapyrrole methylase family protein/MazG family protein
MKDEYKELYVTADNETAACQRLIDIVRILRRQCPWDKVQTHETLRTCMIEEAYEAVDAVNKGDMVNLREELGDVMLQVVLNGIIAENDNEFTITDIVNEECEKMIRRHPHIFSEENSKTIDKVLEKWENVKSKEHGDSMVSDRLVNVPKALPALLRSMKVQKRASQVGFDWNNAEEAFPKIDEELAELRTAFMTGDEGAMQEELGDLLFSTVNVSRLMGINPEEALNGSIDKFTERFVFIEKKAVERGVDVESMTLEEMNEIWEEAKA